GVVFDDNYVAELDVIVGEHVELVRACGQLSPNSQTNAVVVKLLILQRELEQVLNEVALRQEPLSEEHLARVAGFGELLSGSVVYGILCELAFQRALGSITSESRAHIQAAGLRLEDLSPELLAPQRSPHRGSAGSTVVPGLDRQIVPWAVQGEGLGDVRLAVAQVVLLDPRELIITADSERFDNVRVDAPTTNRRIQDLVLQVQAQIYLLPGYLVGRPDGRTAVLGRNGSDTSASILAAALGARQMVKVTNVDGIFDRDPRTSDGALLQPHLGYSQALSIVSAGGHVLHGPAIERARDAGITIRVRSVAGSQDAGTVIGS
ncbi:MAG: hypothetical protein Q8P95_04665, partial [bacterium]|nr:hypothetical protein [bacterium]